MYRPQRLLLVSLLIICSSLLAQTPTWSLDGPAFTASPTDMQAAAARIHAEPFADVTVLFEQDEYVLAFDGRVTDTHQLIYRIENKAGLESWSQISADRKVFATVSPEKQSIVEDLGATAIDYRSIPVEQYVADSTGRQGFDIVYDTVGGATLDASFNAVKRYTGHVVSALGWAFHSLAPLSFRGATYSGVFTLLPLLTGQNQAHHGAILAQAAALADPGKLTPILSPQRFIPTELDAAFAHVERSTPGKVVIEFAN